MLSLQDKKENMKNLFPINSTVYSKKYHKIGTITEANTHSFFISELGEHTPDEIKPIPMNTRIADKNLKLYEKNHEKIIYFNSGKSDFFIEYNIDDDTWEFVRYDEHICFFENVHELETLLYIFDWNFQDFTKINNI